MQVQPLPLLGPLLIQPRLYEDERGFFYESFHSARYAAAGIDVVFVQDNASFSKKNVIRGLHYQESPGQAKLVSVAKGRIWDVVVDIRPDSPTFKQWIALELSDANHSQLFIPIGFAHGFCILSETAEVHYKVSAHYDPAQERTIRWNDPALAIDWPVRDAILSDRDRQAPLLLTRGVKR
jgi:dTDP-4-dehydrorhamnose 3,5-epimerase